MLATVGCSNDTVEAPPVPADRLLFRTVPAQVVAGVPFDPAVQVLILRPDGSIDASSATAVSLTSLPVGVTDTLRGVTTVAAAAGVATFPAISLLRASDSTRLVARASGLTGAESAPIRVVHGEPTQLAFLAQPDTAVAGQPLAALRIQLRDVGGNRVLSANGPVTLTISTGPVGGTATGTVTADLVRGEATLADIRLPRAGTGYTLSATLVGSTTVRPAITRVITVVPAAAADLAFVTEPTASVVGFPVTPAVRVAVVDAFGNTVTTASVPVSVDIAVAAAGTQLTGGTTVTSTAGIATFTNLRVDRPSAAVRLRASAAGLGQAISAAFVVGAP